MVFLLGIILFIAAIVAAYVIVTQRIKIKEQKSHITQLMEQNQRDIAFYISLNNSLNKERTPIKAEDIVNGAELEFISEVSSRFIVRNHKSHYHVYTTLYENGEYGDIPDLFQEKFGAQGATLDQVLDYVNTCGYFKTSEMKKPVKE